MRIIHFLKPTWLILKEWMKNWCERNEFRIFVLNGVIVAVTQQFWQSIHHYSDLDIRKLINAILRFDVSQVCGCVFDVILILEEMDPDFIIVERNPLLCAGSGTIQDYMQLIYPSVSLTTTLNLIV